MLYEVITAIAKKYNISLDEPVKNIPQNVMDVFLYGTGKEKLELNRSKELGGGRYLAAFEGICNNLERRFNRITSYNVCYTKLLRFVEISHFLLLSLIRFVLKYLYINDIGSFFTAFDKNLSTRWPASFEFIKNSFILTSLLIIIIN